MQLAIKFVYLKRAKYLHPDCYIQIYKVVLLHLAELTTMKQSGIDYNQSGSCSPD